MRVLRAIVVTLVVVFLLAPLVVVAVGSVNENRYLDFPPEGFSLSWYTELFTDPGWRTSIRYSVTIAAIAAALAVLIAMPLAYVLRTYRIRLSPLLYTLGILPFMLPPIISALGMQVFWLSTGHVGRIENVIIAHAIFFSTLPLVTISLAMETMDQSLREAARTLGATVKSGLSMPEDDVLPGPIKLHSKAATVFKRANDDKYSTDKAIGALSAFALAASEENGRGHLVITAPTGGSAGVMPALVYALSEIRKVDKQKLREGMLAAAAIGYLCKHHATLSAAEGGCQAEIGVASSMAAALVATVYDAESRVVENAAESALEHHLGMTCDPVAGYVQVPCIERCAFGAVKAWTAYTIASNEIASRHRVDFDATVMALAETAKDMNSKYKETSEAGLALSVTLC